MKDEYEPIENEDVGDTEEEEVAAPTEENAGVDVEPGTDLGSGDGENDNEEEED